MSVHGFTRRLTVEDKASVENLRFAYLANAGPFTANPDAVKWSESDEEGDVLGIFSNQGILLSTMRAESLTKAEDLPPKLDYDFLHERVDLPCGLLGKAVTHPRFEGMGFNTYLRYLAYEKFHRKGMRYIVGTVMPDAPRIPLLKNLGYQFLENPEGWRRYGYNSFGKTLVCYVDLPKNMDHIRRVLEPKIRNLKHEYPYVEG